MNLFIFTRDLRLMDNLGLHQALKDNSTIPIFIFTPEQIINNPYKSNRAIDFMVESLEELDNEIKLKSKNKSKLHYFLGKPNLIIEKIIKKNQINQVFINQDFTPYAKERQENIKKVCEKHNISFNLVEDFSLLPMGTLLNKTQEPYKVYTPFFRNSQKFWKDIPKPKKLNKYPFKNLDNKINEEINLSEIKKYYNKENKLLIGGRKNALKQLKKVKLQKNYSEKRNDLTYQTTLLSAYLKFGCLSIREVFYQFKKDLNNDNTLFSQLLWREFYLYITNYFPQVLQKQISNKDNQDFQEKFSKIKWLNDKKELKLWQDGKTGFPIVDACMRELNQSGYMHNRGRLIVSSFLIKLSLINWREGEKYFATQLIDYDPAQNNGGWQFHHGGASNADYFRILSPISQAERFDKNAEYIKKWIPSLKNIPAKDLINWEENYHKYDLKEINYVKPIFSYQERRDLALKTYKKAFQ
jgi:deoxyribodipyrimidine photo-lyase